MEHCAREDGRIEESQFLRIVPDVLYADGVLVADGIAYADDVTVGPLTQLDSMDFEVILRPCDWRDPKIKERRKKAKKFELLIPNHIPIEQIIDFQNG